MDVIPTELVFSILGYVRNINASHFLVCKTFAIYFAKYATKEQARELFCKFLRRNYIASWRQNDFRLSISFLEYLEQIGLIKCMKIICSLEQNVPVIVQNIRFEITRASLIITTPAKGKYLVSKETSFSLACTLVTYKSTLMSHGGRYKYGRIAMPGHCLYAISEFTINTKRKMIRKLKKSLAFLGCKDKWYDCWKDCKAAGITRKLLYFNYDIKYGFCMKLTTKN